MHAVVGFVDGVRVSSRLLAWAPLQSWTSWPAAATCDAPVGCQLADTTSAWRKLAVHAVRRLVVHHGMVVHHGSVSSRLELTQLRQRGR
jgi:hypothetical protein